MPLDGFKTIEARMLSGRICVSFNKKVVDRFGGFAFCRVCERTSRAGAAHALYVGEHPRPIVLYSETNTVECMVGVEVSPDGVCVKCNEDDVVKCSRNKLQAKPPRIGSQY